MNILPIVLILDINISCIDIYSQYFLPNSMDMGSLLGTILNYKRVPMSTLNGPSVKQILTVAHFQDSKLTLTYRAEQGQCQF